MATLALSASLDAQFSGLTHHVWRVQDGLADQVVQAIAEGSDHYLWVGTTRGLWRFDGTTFTPYAGKFAESFRHGVTCLNVARDGSLWIGTEGSGAFRMRGAEIQAFGASAGLTNPIVRAIKQDASGTMWIGTDLGIYRSVGERFESPLPAGPPRGIGSAALFSFSDGRVYSGGTKLLRFQNGAVAEVEFPAQKEPLRIKSLATDGAGGLWIGTLTGLFHMGADEKPILVGPASVAVRVLGRLPDGTVIAGTAGDGLLTASQKSLRNVASAALGLPSDTVLSETVDAGGNIWIGTQGGLVRLSRTGVHISELPHGSTADFAGLMRDQDGSLWYSSRKVFHQIGDEWKLHDFRSLENARIRVMMRDAAGGLWLGTAGADAYRIAPDGSMTHIANLGVSYVRCFLQARDGTVWIGTDSGVAAYRNGSVVNYYTVAAAPHTLVLSLAEDVDGSIWIGSQRGLFHILRDGHYETLSPEVAMRDEAVWSLLNDKNGSIWIGSDRGLSRLVHGQRTAVPLPADVQTPAIYQLVDGTQDTIWIASPTHVMRVREAALNKLADGQTRSIPIQKFPITNDFPSTEILSGLQPAAFADRDGSAWFASSEGPLHIIPGQQPAVQNVPLQIVRVAVNGRAVPVDGSTQLPPDTRTLEIAFAPVALGPQDTLEFRHRLAGFENWSEPGQARAATYTNLRPSTYRFEAEVLGNGGSQVLASAPVMVVRQNAYFYQRKLFWVFIGCVIALIAWGVHRVRLHELRMSFRAKTDERNRLAREMHDTIIQGCTAVSALLEAHSAEVGSMNDSLLGYAREQIRNTIDEARTAVWELRTYDRTPEPLVPALQKLLTQCTKGTGIAATLENNANDLALDQATLHEVLMTAREAILNTIAHSGANEIHALVSKHAEQACIAIADNGCGFDPAEARAERDHHYGLAGMRERMERIGGSFILESAVDKGTCIELQVPIIVRQNRFKLHEEK